MNKDFKRTIKEFFIKQPTKTKKPIFLSQNQKYVNYQIGEFSYGKPRVLSWGEGTNLIIGRFCSIADGVTILLGGEHRSDWVTTYPFTVFFEEAKHISGHPKTKGDVIIGNDVWIGHEALILSGVKIGNGAVIGARSVVTRDVEPYSIVAGNPAKHMRYRFSNSQIAALEEIAWWNWKEEKLRQAFPSLLSSQIDMFISKYRDKK